LLETDATGLALLGITLQKPDNVLNHADKGLCDSTKEQADKGH
jgi:hypothetical protein